MEEDNRSYHPSPHFPSRDHYHHHHYHHRVTDADVDIDAVADADSDTDRPTTFEDRSPQTFTDMIVAAEQQQQQQLQEESSDISSSNSNNNNSDGKRGEERRQSRISFEQKLPSLSYLLRTSTNPCPRRSTGTTVDTIVPRPLR
eukprot:CAMPEP_0171022476 /NCGR_PEP_ID=MMETSP0736-20130129/31456_1 /TAXON_ID=186038 /ORGANISM="Fragilariopsis kerguelensis, Strain L26-C5" /LENGTH=143 /DNA_ID=CAMNT_0011461321 /DNA_START=128 /DNA_END=555 /DNA_ORIENTATION=+